MKNAGALSRPGADSATACTGASASADFYKLQLNRRKRAKFNFVRSYKVGRILEEGPTGKRVREKEREGGSREKKRRGGARKGGREGRGHPRPVIVIKSA